ncbi:MAG: MSHA biogenesis protein MshN [Paraglaciecola sp.]|jgi:MSHA biogenesis protein MshN
MSVVNKMLKDLDARKGQTTGFSADYQPVQSRPYGLWAVILLTVVVAVAMAGWYFASISHPNNAQPAIQAPIMEQQPTVKPGRAPQPMLTVAKSDALDSLINPDTKPENETHQAQLAENVSEVRGNDNGPDLVVAKAPRVVPLMTVTPGAKPAAETQALQAPATFSMENVGTATSQAGLKQNINDALASGKTLVAIEGLQQLLGSEPTNLRARKKLASLLFAENRIDQAKLVLQQGLSLHPAQGDLRLMLAKLLVQQDSGDSAIQLLLDYSPSAAAQPNYYAYRGALAQRLERFSQAQQDYLLLSKADSSKAKWWLGLAIAQDSQGNDHDARQSYARADDRGQLSPQVIQFVQKRMNDLMGVK